MVILCHLSSVVHPPPPSSCKLPSQSFKQHGRCRWPHQAIGAQLSCHEHASDVALKKSAHPLRCATLLSGQVHLNMHGRVSQGAQGWQHRRQGQRCVQAMLCASRRVIRELSHISRTTTHKLLTHTHTLHSPCQGVERSRRDPWTPREGPAAVITITMAPTMTSERLEKVWHA